MNNWHPIILAVDSSFFYYISIVIRGINQYELAYQDHYDKGTTARAVKKLEEQGYVLRRSDEHDRRITKLYVTKKGEAIVDMITKCLLIGMRSSQMG